MKTKDLTLTALLAVLLAIFGTFKIPGIVPGTEFQLSAPFAVCIAALFGFRRYLLIGVLASMINLLLGTHTILNVLIAMVFRLVAGGIITIGGVKPLILAISGPVGTACGRIVLAAVLHTSVGVLLVGAVPGMIFTAVASLVMYPILKRGLKYAAV